MGPHQAVKFHIVGEYPHIDEFSFIQLCITPSLIKHVVFTTLLHIQQIYYIAITSLLADLHFPDQTLLLLNSSYRSSGWDERG